MSRRQKSRRFNLPSFQRSNGEWAVRGLAALALAICGYHGTVDSLANVLVKADAERALLLSPGNGLILGKYAESAFSRQLTNESRSVPVTYARRALIKEPTSVEALTVLGFAAQLRADATQSDRILEYSSALSRRELRPRIWAIEKAASQGDIKAALRNYDLALRTSNIAPNLLYPTLTAALSEARIRKELLTILAKKPVWLDSFLPYVAKSGVQPVGAAALFAEGEPNGLKVSESVHAALVNSLASSNEWERAWEYYRGFRGKLRRDRSRDANFALQAEARAVFDWRPSSDSRFAAAILPRGGGGVFDFAVAPTFGGVLLEQAQLLPPGEYRLTVASTAIDQPPVSQPYWTLICQDGRELGRLPLSKSDGNSSYFIGTFRVPADCGRQMLSFVARATDDIMGVSGQVLEARLLPV